MDKTEFDLVNKCKQGDAHAQAWLYNTYAPWLLGICMRYFNNQSQAEDILHDSYITIYRKISQLQQNNALKSWMKRIVVNNCLMELKKHERSFQIDAINELVVEPQAIIEPQNLKEYILRTDIEPKLILAIVNKLPIGFRTVFNLYVFEGYSHKQIARELGISVNTSKSQLLRARKLIQQRIYEWALTNKHKDDRNEIAAFSVLLFMNMDLEYIDKLAFKLLNDYCISITSVPPVVINSGNVVISKKMFRAFRNSVFTATGKIVCLVVFIIGLIVLYHFFSLEKFPAGSPKQNSLPDFSFDFLNPLDIWKNPGYMSMEGANNLFYGYDQPEVSVSKVEVKNQPIKKEVVYDTLKVRKVVKVIRKKTITRYIEKEQKSE